MAIGYGALGGSANQILIKILGDSKQFGSELKKADSSLSGFANRAKSYAPMLGMAFAGAAAGFVAMSVKWAAAEEVVSRQTEALLKTQGIAWQSVSREVDAYMKQLERLTSYNDTDLQEAFNTMISLGMSYTDAMANMNTVTSMAYSLNRDLSSMAMLVGKAYNGQTGELSRYGIVLGETMTLQEYVAKNFADASERSKTFQGQMDNLNNQFHNVAEAIGVELLPALTQFMTEMGNFLTAGGAAKITASLLTIGKTAYVVADSFKLMGQSMGWVVAMAAGDKAGAGRMWQDMSDTSASLEKDYRGIAEQLQIIFGEETQRVSTNQNITSSLNAQTSAIQQQTAALNSQLSIEQKIQQLRSVGNTPYGWATRTESNLPSVRAAPGGGIIRPRDWDNSKAQKSGI